MKNNTLEKETDKKANIMNNKFYFFLLVFISTCNSIIYAQFYDSRNYYLYTEVGKTVESTTKFIYVHFNAEGNMHYGAIDKNSARNYYKDNILNEYAINSPHDYKYCSIHSTPRYEVYKTERTETRPYFGPLYSGAPFWEEVSIGGYWYRAFSLDRNELIIWYTTRESNEAKNKKHYKRINPEDLMPKEIEYDFL